MSDVGDSPQTLTRNWSDTLLLPQTDFPMRAGLSKREPEILDRWAQDRQYEAMRADGCGRETFVLHDGPPYANGHLHIGHALNKILKDLVTRSHQMLGYDANYVPGWDCHGLPIEWKVEEGYRTKGWDKDAVPINEFRQECRAFASHWIDVQSEEFQRLGIIGDWKNPYTTMHFLSEAMIADELMKFAMNGALYRGSKPVMWSVVERTALAEAEVEYLDYESDTIWVKFPVVSALEEENSDLLSAELKKASVVIWTTTPWTIPGNRAIAFSSRIDYGLYEVTDAPADNWAKVGDRLILADALAQSVSNIARIDAWTRVSTVNPKSIRACAHPLRGVASGGYDFDVPLLDGDHVTEDIGTGFVHTAPGHGTDDFEIWMNNKTDFERRGIDASIPYTVGSDGGFTEEAPGFTGARVIDDKGKKGDANKLVIAGLSDVGALIARGRLIHQYPHSWRSKKPVIFRNTPQWFIAMQDGKDNGLRATALKAIDATRFIPPTGQTRLRAMIESRPDWVISRQRAWGVPISVFVHKESGEFIPNGSFPDAATLISRITDAFAAEGADAWFAEGARERFLDGLVSDPSEWEKVNDILDVWFESGSTHRFVLETRPDLKLPADVYLEGTDQHRGWFHSSLLESSGTRARAPYDVVVTHGFTMDENGRKMSKSLGNVIAPHDVIKQYGADVLRLWVVLTDYADDQRIGPEILKSTVDSYRKLRNTLRWMLGSLHHFHEEDRVETSDMPELELYILHRLAELDQQVREGYKNFDYKRISTVLFNFMTIDLSAFYFDIRKDALYCDPLSSLTRRSALTVLDEVYSCITAWLAPILCFTMEDVWRARFGDDASSVHLRQFPDISHRWRDDVLGDRWSSIRQVRRAITGALEVERREKRIGSSLEAAPVVYINSKLLMKSVEKVDMAEVAITSQIKLEYGPGPEDAFRMNEVLDVAVVSKMAEGKKCARSWKILPDVGSDPDYPDLSPRDVMAVRELEASLKSG
jgi:isoleucyl-tRNA synthetase